MRANPDLLLMQVYDNGDFFFYGWTPVLAAKGYTPITPADAEPYLKLIKLKKNNIKHVDNTTFIDTVKVTDEAGEMIPVTPPEDGEDEATQDIIKDATKDGEARVVSDDEVRDINVSQEDIQSAEMKHIKGLSHKSSLEQHMLEKYQCEIPMGRLETMKALANSMITDLAKDNRLYYVDGGVVMR